MRLGAAILASLLLAVHGTAENWPQWRGPRLDGTSREVNLPVHWSQTENIAWKIRMPEVSGSTPIVWGENIFLSVSDRGGLWLWCLDRANGAVKWKQKMSDGDARVRKGNLSSPSPVTDGKTVWLLTGTGAMKAFDFSGKELWSRNLEKDYGQWGLNHGYGSSPVLFEDSLYVQVLQGMYTRDPSYVLRVDPKTGKTVWRVERPTDAVRESHDSYTTPAIVRVNNAAQLVVSGGDYVTGHDLATGKELWRKGGLNPYNAPDYRTVASTLVVGDVFIVPSRVNPVQVFRASAGPPRQLWSTPYGPDVPTPVSDGKYLYMVNDRGIVWCFEASTGRQIYGGKRMRPATYTSSLVLADGKIYAANEDGLITVLKAGEQFEVLAENNLDDYILSSPAISEGQIFLRTERWLYCIGKRAAR